MDKVEIHCAVDSEDRLEIDFIDGDCSRATCCCDVTPARGFSVISAEGEASVEIRVDLAGAKKLAKAAQAWIDEQEGGQ